MNTTISTQSQKAPLLRCTALYKQVTWVCLSRTAINTHTRCFPPVPGGGRLLRASGHASTHPTHMLLHTSPEWAASVDVGMRWNHMFLSCLGGAHKLKNTQIPDSDWHYRWQLYLLFRDLQIDWIRSRTVTFSLLSCVALNTWDIVNAPQGQFQQHL